MGGRVYSFIEVEHYLKTKNKKIYYKQILKRSRKIADELVYYLYHNHLI